MEAVIEIKTRMAQPVGADTFAAFQERLKGRYPKVQKIRFIASHLRLNTDVAVTNDVSDSVFDVRLDDAAGQWVVQGKSDGLTVSQRLADSPASSQNREPTPKPMKHTSLNRAVLLPVPPRTAMRMTPVI